MEVEVEVEVRERAPERLRPRQPAKHRHPSTLSRARRAIALRSARAKHRRVSLSNSNSLSLTLRLCLTRRTRLTWVTDDYKVTHMTKTQVYLPEEQLKALHRVAKREGRSLADLIREAIEKVWMRPVTRGPVGLWSGKPKRTSVEHDSIYDEP